MKNDGSQFELIRMQAWSEAFSKLYSSTDEVRKPEEFWNSVMAHLSGVGEAIRRTSYKELVEESAYAFCWLCGFISKCNNIDDDPLFRFENCLSEIVALKFPDRCGHCDEGHCCCNPILKDAEKDKSVKYLNLFTHWKKYEDVWKNRSIENWLNQFWEIFGGRLHIQTIETIGFHMLEEAGEEAKAVRQLVQFRGLAQTKEHGVDNEFLKSLSNIASLVTAYDNFTKEAEKKLGKKFKDANREDILTSEDDVIIKTRLVNAKMDFVIEVADTFSWLCAVLLKLKVIINDLNIKECEKNKYRIEYVLGAKFAQKDREKIIMVAGLPKLKCYVCQQEACRCLFFHKK